MGLGAAGIAAADEVDDFHRDLQKGLATRGQIRYNDNSAGAATAGRTYCHSLIIHIFDRQVKGRSLPCQK